MTSLDTELQNNGQARSTPRVEGVRSGWSNDPTDGTEEEWSRYSGPAGSAWTNRLTLIVADLLMLSLASFAALSALTVVSYRPRGPQAGLEDYLALLPIFIVAFGAYGLYRERGRRVVPSGFHDLVDLAHALIVGGICSLGVAGGWQQATGSPVQRPDALVLTALCALVTVPLGRFGVRTFQVASGRVQRCRVLVMGTGQVANAVISRMSRFPDVVIIGQVDDDPQLTRVLGPRSQLLEICRREAVDRIVVAYSRQPDDETVELLRQAAGWIPISVVPRMFELVTWRSQVEDLFGMPMIDIAPPAFTRGASFLKRTVDMVVAMILLLVLAPAMLAIAVAVKVTSPGPVFFRQQRTGRRHEPFAMYKFRTMHVGAEAAREALNGVNAVDGPLFKMVRDPRLTKIGSALRRYSIDELPQLFNVLLGNMSLVGPRPLVTVESDQITGWADRRLWVRPGMTGLWQVSGRSALTFEDLRRLDYIYVTSWSLWWDLKILWQTPPSVLARRGAY